MSFLRRTWAEIDESALLHNLKVIREQAGNCSVMAVVKANAYGHSAKIVAPLLEKNGVDFFAVSNIEEAVTLRELGIQAKILILGYTPPSSVTDLCKYDIAQCVYSSDYAAVLSEAAVREKVTVKVHIKLDTGMGRIGFDCRDEQLSGVDEALKAARSPNFHTEGLFTHFAAADRTEEDEDGFTDAQYDRFTAAFKRFQAAGIDLTYCHCCNSAALCLDHEKHSTLCRAGIVLYGLKPDGCRDVDFKPVMTVKSVVSMVKEIQEGQTVSYGRTFTAKKPMRVATVSAGYGDGYPRLLSNRGEVLIHGVRAPIVGRVCMDQFMVDVSSIENVAPEDEVVLFGEGLPLQELADLCNTIHYELACNVSPRVPRVAVNQE